MISILPQESVKICFDCLAGSLRPTWEEGPSIQFYKERELYLEQKTLPKTAIHAHIYYLDQLIEILRHGKNIENRHYLINTNSKQKSAAIEKILKRKEENSYEIRTFPNKGRDIGALMVGWRDRLKDFEIMVHCHTKKTPHAEDGFGEAWNKSLLQSIFPERDVCRVFQQYLSRQNAGIIMPWPHKFVAHNVNWGNNFKQTRALMKLMGHNIGRDTLLAFPAGSFFWARVESLNPLFDLALRWQDFCDEPMPGDGRLAHALERCLGLVPMLNNRDCLVHWVGKTCHDMDTGPINSSLITIPNPETMKPHGQTWFRMGWRNAVSGNGKAEQSIALNRRIPTRKDIQKKNMIGFMIAGTQKGGTTALAEYLRMHSELYIPQTKELHFFDEEEQDWNNPEYNKLHSHYDRALPEQLWGEATPITMYWEQCAERIWRYNTNMRFILTLRNPIDRAYSHWAMEVRRGQECLPFSEAILMEEERSRTALPLQDRVHSYLSRGRYSEQIRRLWRWFGREQVLIIRQEDLLKNPRETLNEVCRFLNIREYSWSHALTANQGHYEIELDSELRRQLVETLRGEIMTLQTMLGWDLSEWLAQSST